MPEKQERFRPSLEKRRILLVEDEFINQEILKMILQERYEIIPAENGAKALEIIYTQFETLSLILLDLNLPDIHGLDVLREVKADVRFARIPVIVMTADSDAEVECLRWAPSTSSQNHIRGRRLFLPVYCAPLSFRKTGISFAGQSGIS